MEPYRLHFSIERSDFENLYRIHLFSNAPDDQKIYLGRPIVMELQDRAGLSPHGPAVVFDQASAVELMTKLWETGVRPHGFRDQPGETSAMKEHLADLRKVLDAYIRTP